MAIIAGIHGARIALLVMAGVGKIETVEFAVRMAAKIGDEWASG